MSKPSFEEMYTNSFILYFDTTIVAISSLLQTILLMVWCYNTAFQQREKKITQHIESQNKATSSSDTSANTTTIQKQQNTERQQNTETQQKHTIDKISTILCTLSVVAGTLFCYTWTTMMFVLVFTIDRKYSIDMYCKLFASVFLINFIQRILLYSYYIFRVYYTFNSSIYEFSKIKMQLSSGILLTLWIFSTIFYWTFYTKNQCVAEMLIISLIPAMIMEMFSSLFGALLFIWKLYELMKLKQKNNATNKIERIKYLFYKLCILA
eukprot:93621_1